MIASYLGHRRASDRAQRRHPRSRQVVTAPVSISDGAVFIGACDHPTNEEGDPAAYFRTEFDVDTGLVSATLHLTALGIVEPYLNGVRVGDEVLEPGWTSYKHRLIVRAHDLTASVRTGRNVLGAIVGEGWALGRLGYEAIARRRRYADRPGAVRRDRADVRRPDRTHRHRRRDSEPARDRSAPTASTTAMTDRRTAGAVRLERARASTTAVGARRAGRLGPRDPRLPRSRRRSGASKCSSPSRVLGPQSRHHGRGLRAEHLRLGAPTPCSGPEGHDGHGPPRRGPGPTTSRTTRRCSTRQGDRPVHPRRATAIEEFEPRFTFHGFRYAEIEGLAPATSPPTTSEQSSSTPTWCAPAGSRCSDRADQPTARQRGVVDARTTSSASRPTAPNATSGSAGPATSTPSPDGRRSSMTSGTSSASWLAGPAGRAAGTGLRPLGRTGRPGTPSTSRQRCGATSR